MSNHQTEYAAHAAYPLHSAGLLCAIPPYGLGAHASPSRPDMGALFLRAEDVRNEELVSQCSQNTGDMS